MARVLLVDDSMFMRKLLRDLLTKAGHEVVGEADTGENGLAAIPKLKPELVTLDLAMPGLGGMETLRKLKAQKDAPIVIIVSAVGQKQEIQDALALGAADFIVKPFDEKKVLATVTNALAG